jgi:hypothetical protein
MTNSTTTKVTTGQKQIVIPPNLTDRKLVEAILVYNGLDAQGLTDLFSEDLTQDIVYKALNAHLAEFGALGTARKDVTVAVEARRDAVARGTATYKRALGLIDAAYPKGSQGRAAYFPTDNTDPTLGDLLIAAGKGVAEKGKPKLPEGWTGATLQKLGEEVNTALATRDESGRVRKGRSHATGAQEKRTAEIRRRLRQTVTEWFGATSSKLLAFGITPRQSVGGRKRKTSQTAGKTALVGTENA